VPHPTNGREVANKSLFANQQLRHENVDKLFGLCYHFASFVSLLSLKIKNALNIAIVAIIIKLIT
jgi:hypothetical protein